MVNYINKFEFTSGTKYFRRVVQKRGICQGVCTATGDSPVKPIESITYLILINIFLHPVTFGR
jgi:hypothetical protein